MKDNQIDTLPIFTINQSINAYKNIHERNPGFGMNIFDDSFSFDDVVILEDAGRGVKGAPMRCGFYALILTIKGETKREVNQHNFLAKEQSLHLINEKSIFSFEAISKKNRTYVILFNKRLFNEQNIEELFLFHEQHQDIVSLEFTNYNQVLQNYKQIDCEFKTKDKEYYEISKTLILQILYILKREKLKLHSDVKLSRSEQISREFLDLIEDNFITKKSVKEYAKLLDITPKHLSEVIKNTLHKTALSYIHIRLLKEIQYHLAYTQSSIKQIAHYLNFDSSSQMGRFFRNYENMTPKEYRILYADK